jgi:hypothetical protein
MNNSVNNPDGFESGIDSSSGSSRRRLVSCDIANTLPDAKTAEARRSSVVAGRGRRRRCAPPNDGVVGRAAVNRAAAPRGLAQRKYALTYAKKALTPPPFKWWRVCDMAHAARRRHCGADHVLHVDSAVGRVRAAGGCQCAYGFYSASVPAIVYAFFGTSSLRRDWRPWRSRRSCRRPPWLAQGPSHVCRRFEARLFALSVSSAFCSSAPA